MLEFEHLEQRVTVAEGDLDMRSILETCQPRPDILTGTFNPEIFTASLSQVIDHYRGGSATTHNIYTDAEQFFREATYPTDGLRLVLAGVFGRLAGDGSVPAIHRLETAFGGGKTHTMICLTHLGFQGDGLASVSEGVVDVGLLPAAGEVNVVGIAGDELPIHQTKGTRLVPYTLWGELAHQVGGEDLYREVEESATSFGSPGRDFFEAVLGGRKALILLDELAQYATRLEAARPHGAESLATFLMSLHTYARNHSGISVVLSLASQADAFARQTQTLARLISEVRGEEIDESQAVGIAQQAESGVRSVVARDATTVVPVHAAEISRVLSKRLFERIDHSSAGETADAYMEMYRKNSPSLPEQAIREDFRDNLVSYYPFHPKFISFLTNKLATVENFQGTRGVLRVLALAVRNIWKRGAALPMIHTCHIDVRDARTIDEIIGRTGSNDLLHILNADIGSVDTETIEGGQSNAELADARNPHPAGLPLHEYTWKTVFFHSLVGRDQELGSNLFGITESEALFEVSFPGMTPPQVKVALDEIRKSAYYLRYNEGRYYAHSDPTINIALARLRRGLSGDEVDELLAATARKVVQAGDQGTFWVEHDVSAPEHIPDGKGKPVLGIVALDAGEIDEGAFVTSAGENRPRTQQNCVFLLAPKTVLVKGEVRQNDTLFKNKSTESQETLSRLNNVARDVLARRRLARNPENYGISSEKVMESEFTRESREREQALVTAMSLAYDSLWFPSAQGKIVQKEVHTAGGEGGAGVLETLQQMLRNEGELVTAEHATTAEVVANLGRLFFEQAEVVSVEQLRANFLEKRAWPVLESPSLLDAILRAGVERGAWCLFRMGAAEQTKPEQFYSREEGDLPFDLDLSSGEWELVTVQGAKKRGWAGGGEIDDPAKVEAWVQEALGTQPVMTADAVFQTVTEQHGDLSKKVVMDAIDKQVQAGRTMTYAGDVAQQEAPELIYGTQAMFHRIQPEHVIISPAEASRRGWVQQRERGLSLSGPEGTEKVVALLKELSRLYDRGATSKIDLLDLVNLEIPGGGRLRLTLLDVPPESVKQLGELLDVLADRVQAGEETAGTLNIGEVDESCPLIKRLREEE